MARAWIFLYWRLYHSKLCRLSIDWFYSVNFDHFAYSSPSLFFSYQLGSWASNYLFEWHVRVFKMQIKRDFICSQSIENILKTILIIEFRLSWDCDGGRMVNRNKGKKTKKLEKNFIRGCAVHNVIFYWNCLIKGRELFCRRLIVSYCLSKGLSPPISTKIEIRCSSTKAEGNVCSSRRKKNHWTMAMDRKLAHTWNSNNTSIDSILFTIAWLNSDCDSWIMNIEHRTSKLCNFCGRRMINEGR